MEDNTKFVPSEGQILIKLYKRPEASKGGIVIVRNDKDADKDTNLAEIVAISPEEKKLAVGDVILIRVFAGAWVDPDILPHAEFVYRVIQDNDVLGKFLKVSCDSAAAV